MPNVFHSKTQGSYNMLCTKMTRWFVTFCPSLTGSDSDSDYEIDEEEGETVELKEEKEEEGEKAPSLTEQRIQEERTNMLICNFLFSLVWSVGVTVDGSFKDKWV